MAEREVSLVDDRKIEVRQPQVGDIVLFGFQGEGINPVPMPAIVTIVFEMKDTTKHPVPHVALTLFPPWSDDRVRQKYSVPFSEALADGCWTWRGGSNG